jgi:hypothetical protein
MHLYSRTIALRPVFVHLYCKQIIYFQVVWIWQKGAWTKLHNIVLDQLFVLQTITSKGPTLQSPFVLLQGYQKSIRTLTILFGLGVGKWAWAELNNTLHSMLHMATHVCTQLCNYLATGTSFPKRGTPYIHTYIHTNIRGWVLSCSATKNGGSLHVSNLNSIFFPSSKFHLIGLKQCCIPKISFLGWQEQNLGYLPFSKNGGHLPFSKILRLSSIFHLVRSK